MALSGCLFNNTSAYTYYLVDIGDTDEAMIKYGNQYSDYKFIWDDSGYLYGYNDNNKRVTSRFELVRHQLNTDGVQSIAFSNMVNAAKSLNTDFNEFGELIGEMDKTFVKATSTLIAADSNIGKLINKNT